MAMVDSVVRTFPQKQHRRFNRAYDAADVGDFPRTLISIIGAAVYNNKEAKRFADVFARTFIQHVQQIER